MSESKTRDPGTEGGRRVALGLRDSPDLRVDGVDERAGLGTIEAARFEHGGDRLLILARSHLLGDERDVFVVRVTRCARLVPLHNAPFGASDDRAS